jgi:hypothetical protein
VSRASVRETIATYLEGAGITHLSSVKRHPPKFTSEQEFYQDDDPSHNSGVIIFIYFAAQKETRIALGGAHDGRKAREYEVHLDCYLRSNHRKSQEAGEDNEAFLDSLTAAIEADRNAGAPTIIFQWGEGTFPGSADIEVDSDYPRLINGGGSVTQIYSSVRVSVVEILNT